MLVLLVVLCVAYYFGEKGMGDEGEETELKCVLSGVDGETYCVRDRRNIQRAADLIARVATTCDRFVTKLGQKYPKDEAVQRLVERFDKEKLKEILPTNKHEALTTNKGEMVEVCLTQNSKDINQPLIDDHTLTFVALHELSHIMDINVDHNEGYWKQFRFLLKEADEMGFHKPVDYSIQPKDYCGQLISESPFYNHSGAPDEIYVPMRS